MHFHALVVGYSYFKTEAAKVALLTVRAWLEKNANHIEVDLIIFCLYTTEDVVEYERILSNIFRIENRKQKSEIACKTRVIEELEDSGEEEIKLRLAASNRRELKEEVTNRKLVLVKGGKGYGKSFTILSYFIY